MSKIEVNTVEPQCGTTLTLGGSGDTVTLGSGASQSGFGRTGTVDWQTTKKTSDFTAVNGEGYFVDTGGGAVTATLPASPSAGNIVYIKDYDGNFGTAACTIARNGSNIRGEASDFSLEKNNAGAVFIYVDATEGWQVFVDGSDADAQQTFISATGGTVTTCGNFKIHTFTGPGTFCVASVGCAGSNDKVDYIVVAGGGAGGTGASNNTGKMGGGGAGGFRESHSDSVSGPYTASPLATTSLSVSATAFPITVGGGGAAAPTSSQTEGANGSNSIFSTITSTGGGGGGASNPGNAGQNGGSGGGGAYDTSVAGGSGNTPPVSPSQGNNGGNGIPASPYSAGGGGGATAVGVAGSDPPSASGPGGAGATTSISGSPTAYAGGGGGSGKSFAPTISTKGSGGVGGGGAGGCRTGTCSSTAGVAGTTNTGGGGGAGNPGSGNPAGSVAGSGGSGIVIIRYRYQ